MGWLIVGFIAFIGLRAMYREAFGFSPRVCGWLDGD